MPDIDFQKIELNLIPKKGDDPVVFYASQYETARPFIAVLKWGDSEFAPGVDCYAEIDIRKNDDNLVVITDDVAIDNNEVSVILPVQAVTCIGKNLGQVKIYGVDDNLIAALNFILEVQADPLAGGITSETAIDNLESQIAAIVPEVIGDDYYNKSQTDALLANKADKSELPDMDNYYTQAQVDALLDNIFPTLTASGAIASFTTALNKPLVSVTHEAGASEITLCGINFFDEEWEKGTINQITGEEEPNAYISRTGFIPIAPGTRFYYGYSSQNNARGYYYDSNKNYIGTFVAYASNSFESDVNASYLRLIIGDAYGIPPLTINYPSTDTEYHAYEGQTVPVADATTLTTLSGVNNVFANTGDVTVQYKYMSM